jgi:hypothetical protein
LKDSRLFVIAAGQRLTASAASRVILRNKRFGAQLHEDDSVRKNKSDESLVQSRLAQRQLHEGFFGRECL